MNEGEKIKQKIKEERYKDLIVNICIIIFFVGIICFCVVSSVSKYEPDPSLYVKYDLNKDTIPPPIQKSVNLKPEIWDVKGTKMKITKKASYDITGKVEAIKDYSTNSFSNVLSFNGKNIYDYISPIDLTLSWGKLAKEKNSEYIYCDQFRSNSFRSVYIDFHPYLIQKYGKEIIYEVSNNHIVTLDKELRKILSKIELEDVVRLKGYLIHVLDENGRTWNSSLVRNDGMDVYANSGCEIILIEDIVIMPRD